MGLLTFMNEDTVTTGSISTTEEVKRGLAKSSMEFNLENPVFCRIFPEIVEMFKSGDFDIEEDTDYEDSNDINDE